MKVETFNPKEGTPNYIISSFHVLFSYHRNRGSELFRCQYQLIPIIPKK
jgi:hypothetical protein